MTSGPITSWEIDGETVEHFIFLGSKITADGDCSHEIKRRLLFGRKVMTPRQHIKKQRHYFVNKVLSSQGYLSSGHVCESWTVKKAERRRTDAFELWCWRRLLRVPWTARRSKQSILKSTHQSTYQTWVFTGRTDVEAETPILWPHDVKS